MPSGPGPVYPDHHSGKQGAVKPRQACRGAKRPRRAKIGQPCSGTGHPDKRPGAYAAARPGWWMPAARGIDAQPQGTRATGPPPARLPRHFQTCS
jgi:hypothetical protein